MHAARRTIKELNAAIEEDAYEFLTGWVSALINEKLNNRVTEGIQFEEVLADIQNIAKELGDVPGMPFQYAVSAMKELDGYETALHTVVSWVKDVRGSVECGTLKERFAAEALTFQKERNKCLQIGA